jgi:antitoxin ParD1/3/4
LDKGDSFMASINVSLPQKLKEFTEQQVAGGNYSDESDFVRDLIRKAQERAGVIEEINSALDEAEASGFLPYVREEFETRMELLLKNKNAA